MNAVSKKKILGVIVGCSLLISVFVIFQNCGSSGGGGGGAGAANGVTSAAPAGLGTFIDDPVAGLTYTTSSGLSGVTNSLGQFQFNPGDTVTFYALGVQIGMVAPVIASNGTANVTPVNLVTGATDVTNAQVTSISQLLNTLNTISTATNGGVTGVFEIPTNPNLQSQLTALNSSASSMTQAQLQSVLDSVFGAGAYTVTPASTAQSTLQNGINAASIIGTVWSGACTCNGGATLYFQPNGVLSGLTYNGDIIAGIWSVDGNGNTSFSGATTDGNGSGQGGLISAGATTGTLQVVPGTNGGSSGTINLTEVTSSTTVTNSSWVGTWVITAVPTAYGNSIGDSGGCANLIAGPNFFYAVTNSSQAFSGAVSANGAASGSFPNGSGGATSLNFNMTSRSGTTSQNGQVSDTLSISQGGSCALTKNNNGGGGGGSNSTPTPTPTPSGGSVVLNLSISWANTAQSADSIGVSLTVFGSGQNNLGHQTQSEASNSQNFNGTPITTTDNISVNWTTGVGASYQVTVGTSPCSVTNGSGTIGSNGTYPTVQISCN